VNANVSAPVGARQHAIPPDYAEKDVAVYVPYARQPLRLLPEEARGGGVGSPSERIRSPGGRGPRARAPAAPRRDATRSTARMGRGR